VATRYCITTTASPGNWDTTATWSETQGGASGASVPGAGDTAVIPNAKGVILNVDVTVARIEGPGWIRLPASATITLTVTDAIAMEYGNGFPIVITAGQTLTINGNIEPDNGSLTFQVVRLEGGGTLYHNGDWSEGYCVSNDNGTVVHVGVVSCTLYNDMDVYEQTGASASFTHTGGDITVDWEGHAIRIHGGTATLTCDILVKWGEAIGTANGAVVTLNGDITLDATLAHAPEVGQIAKAYAYGMGEGVASTITHNGDLTIIEGRPVIREDGLGDITHNGRVIWDDLAPKRYSRRTLPISVGVGQALVVGA
jgi:hypothetical protein